MDILEFFELSAGKWFSQRTVHNLTSGALEAGKSNLTIALLGPEDGTLAQLCDRHGVAPATAGTGWHLTWDGTVDSNTDKQVGEAVLVPVADRDRPREGRMLQQGGKNPQSLAGRYSMGDDDVLTVWMESETFTAEERLWYLMPNLRLRTSVVKYSDGMTVASFCSEIRMISK
ncbi:phycobiliprotein lyase [Lyngbya sp. CCY1209]|jgi:hypothetical protein|uniref:phycobiliprotein lyase n=1 Tax=Lyngbya sp. CCY1209 TaxID=2886103 RepID=UPI002D21274F|nr:phycobiliprotein lyase [Lyngbya sp. CCY1209]MEB3882111.1 phycobiliprotein lyase [Lyngbya sp. CCY1209]